MSVCVSVVAYGQTPTCRDCLRRIEPVRPSFSFSYLPHSLVERFLIDMLRFLSSYAHHVHYSPTFHSSQNIYLESDACIPFDTSVAEFFQRIVHHFGHSGFSLTPLTVSFFVSHSMTTQQTWRRRRDTKRITIEP